MSEVRQRLRKPRENPRPMRSGRKESNLTPLKEFLSNLDISVNPAIHVNGTLYPTAVIAVDFGSPVHPPLRLSTEDVHTLQGLMRTATAELYARDTTIRVSADVPNGVFWSAVA